MTRTAVFIDLSNIYNQLLRTKWVDDSILRDYFLDWLNFRLLAQALTNGDAPCDVWVFYSSSRIGGSSGSRITGEHLPKYIERINLLDGVTAWDVNIPGEQRESVQVRCSNCKQPAPYEWTSEKGVDASLTVYMFDTMDTWDDAYLVSGDADYVPVVKSLRRRGKLITAVGFPDSSSSALIRECYRFVDIGDIFIQDDLATYLLFKEKGIIQRWFTEDIGVKVTNNVPEIDLYMDCERGPAKDRVQERVYDWYVPIPSPISLAEQAL